MEIHALECSSSAGAFMVDWANNLAFKIALNMYLSNTPSKSPVNMNFHKGLYCVRRNVFLIHREFFKMNPPSSIS